VQSDEIDVRAPWIRGTQALDETGAQVLVEEQPHAARAAASRRSRAAAKARLARRSSLSFGAFHSSTDTRTDTGEWNPRHESLLESRLLTQSAND
jgi:hypothetical protein